MKVLTALEIYFFDNAILKAKKKIQLSLFGNILIQLEWNFRGNSAIKKEDSVLHQNEITRIHQGNVDNAARIFQRHFAHFKGLILGFFVHSKQ